MTSGEAAERWLDAVESGDGREAWRLTDPAYRRVLVDRWAVAAGLTLSEADVLALTEEGHDPAWGEFADAQLLGFLDALPDEIDENWGWTDAHPEALDLEKVQLVDPEEFERAKEETSSEFLLVPGVTYYMRYTGDAWLLAGLYEAPAEQTPDSPGWESLTAADEG